MRVEGVGLNRAPDMYCARSLFVCSSQMILFAICLGLIGTVEEFMFVFSGMIHSPLVLLFPVMMTLLFLII